MFFTVFLDLLTLTGLTVFCQKIMQINKVKIDNKDEVYFGKISHGISRSIACFYFSLAGTKLWLTCSINNLSNTDLYNIKQLSISMITYFNWDLVVIYYQYCMNICNPRIDLTVHHTLAIVGFYSINRIYPNFLYLTIYGAMSELLSIFSGLKLLSTKLGWLELESNLIKIRLIIIIFWRIPVWLTFLLTVYNNAHTYGMYLVSFLFVSSIMYLEFKWFKSGILQLLRC